MSPVIFFVGLVLHVCTCLPAGVADQENDYKRFLLTHTQHGHCGGSGPSASPNGHAKKFPVKSDRIAIVGAGPAGVHMAYKLQKQGFRHVTVFEKLHRIGGKSYTYNHKGIRHEFGTLFATPEYFELFKLLKEFGGNAVLPADRASNWIDSKHFLDFEYVFYAIDKEFGIKNRTEAMNFINDAAQRYIQLHQSLFSNYTGDLMPRPSSQVLHQTRGTFLQFLARHNMTVLKLIFLFSQNVQGYGSLDEISSIYGLMWNTPEFVKVLLHSDRDTSILKNGFQSVWKSIVSQANITVILNANIKHITRNNHVQIQYDIKHGKTIFHRCNNFDFLILAANMKRLLPHITDVSTTERHTFNKLTPAYFTLTLVDSNYGVRGSTPTNYFFYNVFSPAQHDVWASIDNYAALHSFSGDNYTRGVLPDNPAGEYMQTTMFYQYGDTHPSAAILNSSLHTQLMTFGMTNYTVIKQKIWTYFPRYNPVDMSNGILWDILDMQGYKKTWYIGSSVTFESVKSVLEYNKLLLRKFNLRDD